LIASPIAVQVPKNEGGMIRPAVDGALRVLKAARDAGVKRMVMTSNFRAVGYSHKDPSRLITEEDWTDQRHAQPLADAKTSRRSLFPDREKR
jgi:nucleoside-diphosphate-sugar epimerase